MSWNDIENAMHKAVVEASGLHADNVRWSYQDANEQRGTHVIITFGGETAIGQDWIAKDFDATRALGQEFRFEVHGVREVPFQIEVFTDAVVGEMAARRVAEMIRTRMRLDGVRSGLRRARVSPFDSGSVSYVPDIQSARFRGRAVCTLRCYVPTMDCIEYATYIARVTGTVYPTGFVNPTGYGYSGFAFDSSGVSGGYSPGLTYTVYSGSAAIPGAYDEAFVESLTAATQSSRVGTFVFSGSASQYNFVAMPVALGLSPSVCFDDETGIEAGMTTAASSVSVDGTLYTVLRSEVAGLGTWTLSVTE